VAGSVKLVNGALFFHGGPSTLKEAVKYCLDSNRSLIEIDNITKFNSVNKIGFESFGTEQNACTKF